ncbi:hypothetical protein SCHPADRAFT_937467 [Schizopora paradoxa]|uniref:Alcohol acetyltransferase n=1 Tax=Schizopora paradoxa TaxID=27342 RepID=A0A0H2RZ94_9AGAM|nr:hypothetical protein SCHPADRAFT_937467 [Schizopora paradoxa]
MEDKQHITVDKVEHDYRQPGLLERYYIARSYLGFDSCVVVGAKYVGSAGESLSKRILYPALSKVVQKHAALSASIKGAKSKEVSIGRLPSLNFSKVVEFLDISLDDDEARDRFLEIQFERPILPIEGQPLWRLTVTTDNFVVFFWSHVVGDGLSGQAFHKALLEALNNAGPPIPQSLDSPEEVIAIPDNIQLLPPLENLTDVSVSIMTFLRALIGIIIPRSWTESKVWSGNNVVAEPRLSTKVNVRSFNLTPETSKLLLSLSKKNGATLTSFLHTACVGVLSTLIEMGPNFRQTQQPRSTKYTSVGSAVPVSLRSIANVDTVAFGNFVSAVYSSERLQPINADDISTPTFPWKTASSYAEKLRNGVPRTRETVGTIKYLFGNYEGFFLGKLGKKRQLGLEISNLGAFTIKKQTEGESGAQNWTIGRVFFSQDDRVVGNALKVSVAGGLDGSLGITISWGEGSVDGDFAVAFTRDLREVVSKIQ